MLSTDPPFSRLERLQRLKELAEIGRALDTVEKIAAKIHEMTRGYTVPFAPIRPISIVPLVRPSASVGPARSA